MHNHPIAICVECQHCVEAKGGDHSGAWYNYFCKAVPREERVDPVTGRRGYRGTNDFGMDYTTYEAFQFCRDINKSGDCALFKPKGKTFVEKVMQRITKGDK